MFHHDPAHTDAQIDGMLEKAQKVAADHYELDVGAASEGTTVDLGSA
jgi:hypothetical protein